MTCTSLVFGNWTLKYNYKMTCYPGVLCYSENFLGNYKIVKVLLIELQEILFFPTFHHAHDLQNVLAFDKEFI